jgi:flavin reductase (DIM6/NTAB) family NADH-FMN oxidoreductase RutF
MRRWVPEFAKRMLRPVSQWTAVALRQPQDVIQVRLAGMGADFDVAANNVVAALRPLTLAIGLDQQRSAALERASDLRLRFLDSGSQRELGVLGLERLRDWTSTDAGVALFRVSSAAHQCLPWPYRNWNRWLQNRAVRRNTDPANFAMSPQSTQQIMIFYICPRPVVLVSVEHERHSNIFPMDLIGPLAPDRFTLALRSTSVSVEPMKCARRVAVSDISAGDRQIAYRLGAHHKNAQIDWSGLPFKINRSAHFSLPVPDSALRIRELEILDFEVVGSHTLFLTRVMSEHVTGDGAQLFHTSGIHQYFRQSSGRALPLAT